MKAIVSLIVLVLMIGAQSAYADREYQAGFNRGVSDSNTYKNSAGMGPPVLNATIDEIAKHPSSFH